jgi:hypothetical protein
VYNEELAAAGGLLALSTLTAFRNTSGNSTGAAGLLHPQATQEAEGAAAAAMIMTDAAQGGEAVLQQGGNDVFDSLKGEMAKFGLDVEAIREEKLAVLLAAWEAATVAGRESQAATAAMSAVAKV